MAVENTACTAVVKTNRGGWGIPRLVRTRCYAPFPTAASSKIHSQTYSERVIPERKNMRYRLNSANVSNKQTFHVKIKQLNEVKQQSLFEILKPD